MKAKLNKDGLTKIIPWLEQVANEMYGDHGDLYLRIGYDGGLRIEAKNPGSLVEEASKSGLTIAYVGRDKFGDYCFDVYAPVSEQLTLPPGLDVTTPAGTPMSHSPTSVSSHKSVGVKQSSPGAKPDERPGQPQQQQGQPDQNKIVQAIIDKATPELQKAMQDMFKKIGDNLLR